MAPSGTANTPVPELGSQRENGRGGISGGLGQAEEGVVLDAALPQVLARGLARRLEAVRVLGVLERKVTTS